MYLVLCINLKYLIIPDNSQELLFLHGLFPATGYNLSNTLVSLNKGDNEHQWMKNSRMIFIITCCMIFSITITVSLFSGDSKATLDIGKESPDVKRDTYNIYTNDTLGISFEYPFNWTLTEKQYLFDIEEPDVQASEFKFPSVYRLFNYINSSEEADQNLKLGLDLEDITKAYKDQLIIKYERVNVTESPVLQEYIIGNYPVGTFILDTYDEIMGSPVTQQIFLVERNDEINILEYVTLKEDFGSKQSQEILNHIINSFRFT